MIVDLKDFSKQEIEKHHLAGLAFSTLSNSEFRDQWKNQLIRNKISYQELLKLESIFCSENIEVTFLKGFSLMGGLYSDWGARFASDIDLLIDAKNLEKVRTIFIKNGFKEIFEKKWVGNDFKVILSKKLPLFKLTVELHSKLFWHIDSVKLSKVKLETNSHYTKLDLEDQLIHLCGHLAFQHTFIKLFWLYDIEKFIELNESNINWDYFWKKSKDMRLYNSCRLTLSLVSESILIPNSLKVILLKKVCSSRFLMNPREHKVRYFLIKFFIKDNLWDSIYYSIFYFFKNVR